MPFGLNNADATYQRAISTIFRDHLQKTVELTLQSRVTTKATNLHGQRTVFDIMQAHQLKMNPTKSFLRV